MAGDYFLKNHWYVVAHDDEVSADKPLARKICDIPMVFYRGRDGGVIALDDRCPHRAAPLSSGEIHGDEIQCGYHGIRYARDGRCVLIPGKLAVPDGFGATAYHVTEKHGFVWAWFGEKPPDVSLIPDFFENKCDTWKGVPGYLHVAANYLLYVDNILDLTHVDYVHKSTLASGDVADTPLDVRVEGDRVLAERMMYNINTANIYRAARNLQGRIDRWQLFEWSAPMYVKVTLGAKEAGANTPMGEPVHRVLNAFTPETEKTHHYFWSTARPWALHDEKVDALYRNMIIEAFNEDKTIIEMQQRLIDVDPGRANLVNLPFDKAGLSARRILRRMMDEERAAAP